MRNTGIGIGIGFPCPSVSGFINSYSYHLAGGSPEPRINAGSAPGLNYGLDVPFSTGAWVKITAGGFVIAKQYGFVFAFQGWGLYVSGTGRISVSITQSYPGSDLGIQGPVTNVADGAWHYVAMVKGAGHHASDVALYLDGATVTPITVLVDALSGEYASTADLLVGASESPGNNMTGYVDEPAIWAKALSVLEIAWLYATGHPRDLLGSGAPSDLAWWLRADGDTYPTATDHGPNGINAQMYNMNAGDIAADVP